MPALADDDVVVHGDAQRPRDIDDGFGHLHTCLRRRRVAGGMVVHEHIASAMQLIQQRFSKPCDRVGTRSGAVTRDSS
jgi:hypothetical protein